MTGMPMTPDQIDAVARTVAARVGQVVRDALTRADSGGTAFVDAITEAAQQEGGREGLGGEAEVLRDFADHLDATERYVPMTARAIAADARAKADHLDAKADGHHAPLAKAGRIAVALVQRVRDLHRPVCGGACEMDTACDQQDLVCDQCSIWPCPTISAIGEETGR